MSGKTNQVEKPEEERKSKAIIYIRTSTPYQVQTDSNSSEMQRSACINLCLRNDLIVKKVIEQVKSGRKLRQDLFDAIQHEMRAGDSIVVYSISRFARKQLHAHQLLDILKRKKCRLLSWSENTDTSKDETNVGLFAWLAEIESKQTSARVKSSIEAKRERLEHIGALPYGYRYSQGKGSPLEVCPEEMDVLIKMRTWKFTENKSYFWICRQLNNDKVPMPKKKSETGGWVDCTVRKLINRDDSKILLRGKRSWYLSQEEEAGARASESSDTDDEDSDPATQEVTIREETPQNAEAPQTSGPDPVLERKPLPVLRAMLIKRKDEFALAMEDIKEMSREDVMTLLR